MIETIQLVLLAGIAVLLLVVVFAVAYIAVLLLVVVFAFAYAVYKSIKDK